MQGYQQTALERLARLRRAFLPPWARDTQAGLRTRNAPPCRPLLAARARGLLG